MIQAVIIVILILIVITNVVYEWFRLRELREKMATIGRLNSIFVQTIRLAQAEVANLQDVANAYADEIEDNDAEGRNNEYNPQVYEDKVNALLYLCDCPNSQHAISNMSCTLTVLGAMVFDTKAETRTWKASDDNDR